MVLKATLKSLKSLKLFILKVKKYFQHQHIQADTTYQQSQKIKKTSAQMDQTSQAMTKGQQENSKASEVTFYPYNHTEDLVARINEVFILYRSAVNSKHAIVYNGARCRLALDLRSFIPLKMADVLYTNANKSILELHKLGLRLPGNPLAMNSTYDDNVEIRKTFLNEFGFVFENTSMEMLGLITALHIIDKALTWLKQLVPTIQRQEIVTTAGILQEQLELKSEASSNSHKEIRRKSSTAFIRNAMANLKKNAIPNLRSGLRFPHVATVYDRTKELPESALDRWVLEERSYGKEPSLEMCQRMLQGFENVSKAYKNDKGQPPPPVSDVHGPINHALYLQRNVGKAPVGMSGVNIKPQSIQHMMADRQLAEKAAKTTTKSEHVSPQDNGLASTGRLRPTGSVFSRSPANILDPADEILEPVPSITSRFLRLTRSFANIKASPMKISAPVSLEHQASGADLASFEDIERALLAANGPRSRMDSQRFERSARNKQPSDLPDQAVLPTVDMSSFKLPNQAVFPTPDISPLNLSTASSPALSSTVVTTPELIPTLLSDRLKALNKTAAKLTLSPKVAVKAKKMRSQEPLTQSLLDQTAKAEDAIAQLLLMRRTFEVALKIVAAQGPSEATISAVTDLAVAWGWFKNNPKDYRKEFGLE